MNPFVGPIVILLLLWADFIWIVHREWTFNDQYSYGWLTPFLVLYLVYARISDRPRGSPGGMSVAGLILLGVLILSLNRIIVGANPEWRLAVWLHALTVFALTLSLLWRMGGWPWVRHFAPAFALILFAVPWPTFLENPVTGGLMRAIAAIVVEGMNLCGIYAEKAGNLIRLRTGWVGVEAACSGVRNLQSTLMSAWFVGELFRFNIAGRGLLLLLGGLASLLLNVGRTWVLAWTTHRSGASLTESIHDPVGHIVSALTFVLLLAVAFLLRKFFSAAPAHPRTSQSNGPPPAIQHPSALSLAACISIIAVLAGGYGFAWLWYYRVERSLPDPRPVIVDWQRLPDDFQFIDIAPSIRGQLKYSDGIQAEWAAADGRVKWQVFFFSWTNRSVSPFVGVHNPATCMPASGFYKAANHPPLLFRLDDEQIEFEVTTFYFMERPYQVYYATWNDYWSADVPFVENTADRLRLAWSGRRLTSRRSLQVVIEGIADEKIARQGVQSFLETALRWENPE